jgi:ABC-type polysaccharide/polyol phosphate export permease
MNHRKLIYSLAIIDFKEKFHGSYLGMLWALLRPLIFISVVWAIFSVGIKGKMISSDVPFIIYLLTGYIPWIFFSSAVTGTMNAFLGNRSLVKRPSFPILILPIVKIFSELIMHMIFLLILLAVMGALHLYPSIYWLQLVYYLLMLSVFLFGLGLFLASLRVFTKDIAEFVGSILQIGFWVTPIFWSVDHIPQKYTWMLHFNPMVYIINGYRNTFINHVWFWEDGSFLLSFLVYTGLFLIIGLFTFKKMKPHFGDVL